MNIRVYLLALSAFVVGMVELVIGGILPMISEDLGVSISAAGQLITVFAFVLAVAGPLMLVITAKIERKRLYIWMLLFFFIGNLLSFISPNFAWLMAARLFTAVSASLITVMSLTIAPKLVDKQYQARAIGAIYMGISSSLVLGVPIGVLIGEQFGWRAPFLFIAVLTLIAMIVLGRFMPALMPEKLVPIRQQVASLRNLKLLSAHLVTVLMLAGHYTVYAYFNPFLQSTLHLDAFWISAAYFVFGLAAVSGGAVGGWLSDRLDAAKSMIIVVAAFAMTLFLLPAAAQSIYIFPFALIAWGMLSWAISPPQQSYLIQAAPETASIQQSINNSALQLGIALGSAVGGAVANVYPVTYNPWFGGALVLLALGFAVYSVTRPAHAASVKSAETRI